MKQFRWQIIIILLTGLVVGLLLLSEQTGFRLVSPVPARGGTYSEALVGSLQRLNPVLDYYNTVDRDVDRLIFSSLISYNSDGLPIPDLANEWGISFDGLTYNFLLNENAVWHDGVPVTANDVAFTINLMRDPDSVLPEDIKDFWNRVEVNPLGEKQIQFVLQEPFAPFMDFLNFGIIPSHILSGMTYSDLINSEFNLNPIGSGPYTFEGVISEGSEITGVALTANNNYFQDPPFINEIIFKYYETSKDAYEAYLNGSVQGIGLVDRSIITDVLSNQNIALYSVLEPEISMVLLNLNNSSVDFFQEKEIRKALLLGIDKKGLIKRVLNGQGVVADVPILKNSWAFYDGINSVEQNNQESERLLREAGYVATEGSNVRSSNGNPLSFTMVHPDDAYHTGIAESLEIDWAKIGVEVNLLSVPYEALILDHLQPLTYEAALIDINYLNSPDPDPYPFWDQAQQTGGQNYSQWENRVASQYLEEARITADYDERAKLYRNFQVVFMDELPAIPLFYPVMSFAIDESVQGVRVGALYDTSDRFWNLPEWFLISQTGINTGE